MPPRKRHSVTTDATYCRHLCTWGPDVTPTTRGRPVTPHVTAPTAAAPDPIALAAEAITDLTQLEASGRLLPTPTSDPTFDGEFSQQDDDVVSFGPVDSVSDDILNMLGDDVPSQSPSYNVINRPLGGNLPIEFKQNIWNGDIINLHMLQKDHEFEDTNNQRLSLELK